MKMEMELKLKSGRKLSVLSEVEDSPVCSLCGPRQSSLIGDWAGLIWCSGGRCGGLSLSYSTHNFEGGMTISRSLGPGVSEA